MDNTVRISLTIELEGSTLIRQSEPEKVRWIIKRKDVNPKKYGDNPEGNQILKSGFCDHRSLKTVPAYQQINLTKDAYDHMISKDGIIRNYGPKEWSKLNRDQRIEANIQEIVKSFGGKSYKYKILPD